MSISLTFQMRLATGTARPLPSSVGCALRERKSWLMEQKLQVTKVPTERPALSSDISQMARGAICSRGCLRSPSGTVATPATTRSKISRCGTSHVPTTTTHPTTQLPQVTEPTKNFSGCGHRIKIKHKNDRQLPPSRPNSNNPSLYYNQPEKLFLNKLLSRPPRPSTTLPKLSRSQKLPYFAG